MLHFPENVLLDRSVGGTWGDFLMSGQETADNIDFILSKVGLSISLFDRILDFGCGCGRTLRFMIPYGAKSKPLGVDVDAAQIEYCQSILQELGNYMVIPHEPPMPIQGELFDFIYSISTFTHFREDYQHHWLKELHRVSRPGATLILTIAGKKNLSYLNKAQQVQLAESGFVFVEGAARANHNPAYYHLALHTHDYVRRVWKDYFDIVDIVPEIINDNQTAVLCQRRNLTG